METALFGDRIVTVVSFQKARQLDTDAARCPVCGEDVFLSGARSLKKAASFNHKPRDEEATRCPVSYQSHPSYSWLEDVDKEELLLRAEALKRDFYQLENLQCAFTFLTRLTGKGAVSEDVFELLLHRAEKFDIWRYSGLPVWAVPYILLTLTDFYIRRESKPTYVIRFVIDKPSRSKLNTTWLSPGQCRLVKYFVNKGKATKMFGMQGAKQSGTPTSTGASLLKNPLPFSKEEYDALTRDKVRLSASVERFLSSLAAEPVDKQASDESAHHRPAQAGPRNSTNASEAARMPRAPIAAVPRVAEPSQPVVSPSVAIDASTSSTSSGSQRESVTRVPPDGEVSRARAGAPHSAGATMSNVPTTSIGPGHTHPISQPGRSRPLIVREDVASAPAKNSAPTACLPAAAPQRPAAVATVPASPAESSQVKAQPTQRIETPSGATDVAKGARAATQRDQKESPSKVLQIWNRLKAFVYR